MVMDIAGNSANSIVILQTNHRSSRRKNTVEGPIQETMVTSIRKKITEQPEIYFYCLHTTRDPKIPFNLAYNPVVLIHLVFNFLITHSTEASGRCTPLSICGHSSSRDRGSVTLKVNFSLRRRRHQGRFVLLSLLRTPRTDACEKVFMEEYSQKKTSHAE